jgi:hypothetical protein
VESLDLTKAPPRAPREELAGIRFLPRSIDKVRATLPDGVLGEYLIEGLTTSMLDALGITVAAFTDAVRVAKNDDEIAAFATTHAKPGGIEVWHRFIDARQPQGGDPHKAIEAYPFLAGRSDLGLSLDVIAEDDRLLFARGHAG